MLTYKASYINTAFDAVSHMDFTSVILHCSRELHGRAGCTNPCTVYDTANSGTTADSCLTTVLNIIRRAETRESEMHNCCAQKG